MGIFFAENWVNAMTFSTFKSKMFYSLALMLLAFVSWRGFLVIRANWIVEFPTCLQLTFEEKSSSISEADVTISDVLSELAIPQIRESKKFARYAQTADVWVRWEYPSPNLNQNQSRLNICQEDKNSDKWKSVALSFESKLAAKYLLTKAQILRNPRVFDCSVDCTIDVAIPLNFHLLNATILKKSNP